MNKKLVLNYTEAKVVNSCVIANTGKTIRGHEFHYSRIENVSNDSRFGYQLSKGVGINGCNDGFIEYNTLASYMHMHFANRNLVKNLLVACKKYSKH